MAALYHSLFTEKGLALLRESIQNGTKLGITHMSFGDGGGMLPTPDATFTHMVNEVYRVALNRLAPSRENPNWLEADGVIPSAVGGFNIREVGLWAGNVMVAYANYPPTYKPSGDQGTAQIKSIRIVLQIDNTANFELKIDASVVMATIQALEDAKIEVIDFANKTKVQHVNSIEELLGLEVWDGRTVFVKSYWEGESKAGGSFVFDSSKSNINDGGIVINGWVRQIDKEYFIEYWGVQSNGLDQSLRFQNALDYCLKNRINSIKTFGKEYFIDSTVTFDALDSNLVTEWGYADKRLILDLNGATIKTHNDNLTFFKILRDHISIINGTITGTYGKKQRAIVLGYDLNEAHKTGTRESVMWVNIADLKLNGLDIGIQFNPNYGGYGMYYHKIFNIDARDVKILFYGEQNTSTQDDIDRGRGSNKVTRSVFNNITHVGGSCTVFFKDIETSQFKNLYLEFIQYQDNRLPDGEAVCIFIPEAQIYNPLSYDNNSLEFHGAFEAINRTYNFGQKNQAVIVDINTVGETSSTSFIGSEWTVSNNVGHSYHHKTANIPNYKGTVDVRPVTVEVAKSTQEVRNSYPLNNVDIYGSLISFSSTGSQSPETFQLFAAQLSERIYARFNLQGNWLPWFYLYHSRNTTVTADGTLKAASPIVKLFSDHIEWNDEIGEQIPEFEKLEIGHYLVKNTSGLAKTGWWIEVPTDSNGNKVCAIKYKELENGDIEVKTFKRKFDIATASVVADEENPIDIPDNINGEPRWIDLRLNSIENVSQL